jgi:hypothetical protein
VDTTVWEDCHKRWRRGTLRAIGRNAAQKRWEKVNEEREDKP